MEEQKDNLELTESSLDKQEGNIQEINSAEARLEENPENVDEVNALEENAKNQDDINALDKQEYLGENEEDKLKKNADQNAKDTIIEKEETELETPKKPQNPNAKWYILQAYAGYEGRVEKTINEKLKIEDDIAEDFSHALLGIKQLPASSKLGVYVAYRYYLSLFKKINSR